MEETRASIRDTVEELRDRVSDTFDWRQYVHRHPGASLTVAVALGMVVGRVLGGRLTRNGESSAAEPYEYAAEVYRESGIGGVTTRAAESPRSVAESAQAAAQSAYAAAEPALSGARRVLGQSASRLGSRAEGILNRLIDEFTEAVETHLVPALVGRFRNLIDIDGRSGRLSSGGYGAGSGFAGESRAGYTGTSSGSAGSPRYAAQGRGGEPG